MSAQWETPRARAVRVRCTAVGSDPALRRYRTCLCERCEAACADEAELLADYAADADPPYGW